MTVADTRARLLLRSLGRCERCGARLAEVWPGFSMHHRRARGMGGSRTLDGVHGMANLLLLCGSGTTGCHGEVERDRFTAMAQGFLVRRNGIVLPDAVPVLYRLRDWRLLTGDGRTVPTSSPV